MRCLVVGVVPESEWYHYFSSNDRFLHKKTGDNPLGITFLIRLTKGQASIMQLSARSNSPLVERHTQQQQRFSSYQHRAHGSNRAAGTNGARAPSGVSHAHGRSVVKTPKHVPVIVEVELPDERQKFARISVSTAKVPELLTLNPISETNSDVLTFSFPATQVRQTLVI